MNDWVRENPAATVAIIALALGGLVALLRWSLARNIATVDRDVQGLQIEGRDTRKRLREVERTQTELASETRAGRDEVRHHMEQEETRVWPALTRATDAVVAVHRRLDEYRTDDLVARGANGERLARLEVLIRNGGGQGG